MPLLFITSKKFQLNDRFKEKKIKLTQKTLKAIIGKYISNQNGKAFLNPFYVTEIEDEAKVFDLGNSYSK